MFDKKLVLKIFEGFSIERWNDLIRPFDLIEMDKSAEKMVLAYIIGKFEENRGVEIDWDWIIYASVFELFKKIALCDIKSPVQRMIRKQYPEEYKKLSEWVINQYRDLLHDDDLFSRFEEYMIVDQDSQSSEKNPTQRVFRAAHKFSTMREFEMIAAVNENFRIVDIQRELQDDLRKYMDLVGVPLLTAKQRPYEFLMLVETLRFQTRWNQTPRVPKTSVLGHSFFVAIITLLLGRQQTEVSFCKRRVYNNFFSALFHDLPESVTRDIISPVKQATEGLPSIVKNIEDKIVHDELLPLMEDFYRDELVYFTSDEFENRVLKDGTMQKVSFNELNTLYNSEEFSPIDGALVRASDHIAAFLEADQSIQFGITSEQLRTGRENLRKMYENATNINGCNISAFFTEK